MRLAHLTVPALASVMLLSIGLQPAKIPMTRRAQPEDRQLTAEAALAYERASPAVHRFEGGAR